MPQEEPGCSVAPITSPMVEMILQSNKASPAHEIGKLLFSIHHLVSRGFCLFKQTRSTAYGFNLRHLGHVDVKYVSKIILVNPATSVGGGVLKTIDFLFFNVAFFLILD